jgi:hypothetical protein
MVAEGWRPPARLRVLVKGRLQLRGAGVLAGVLGAIEKLLRSSALKVATGVMPSALATASYRRRGSGPLNRNCSRMATWASTRMSATFVNIGLKRALSAF